MNLGLELARRQRHLMREMERGGHPLAVMVVLPGGSMTGVVSYYNAWANGACCTCHDRPMGLLFPVNDNERRRL